MPKMMSNGVVVTEACGRKKNRDFLIYTVSFLFVVLIFSFFLGRNGVTFIRKSDPFNQDYPIFLYLGNCLRRFLFYAEVTTYDFTIGLGENVIAPLNLYGFGDPLNLLSVFATGRNAEYLYAFLILLRMYLAGMGMILYLRSHGHIGLLAVGASVIYCFSHFAVVEGMYFYQVLNAMYLLPFLLMQMENLIKGRKIYRSAGKYAVLVMVQTCCCFYFLYIQTLFMFFYALYYYFKEYGKGTFSLFYRKFISVLGSYLLGIMASGLILFPTLQGFFHSSRTVKEFIGDRRILFSIKQLLTYFSNLVVPMIRNDNFGLGLPIICVVACVIVFRSGGWRQQLIKYALILALAAYICPLFWSVLNGFAYAADRWHYLLYFFIAYVTVVALEDSLHSKISGKVILAACGIVLVSILLHLYFNGDKIRSAAYMVQIIAIGKFMICRYYSSRNKEKICFGFLYGGLLINILFLLAPWQVCGHDFWNQFCTQEEIRELTDKRNSTYEISQWERKDTDVLATSEAESIVAGYMGTAEYYSILNENTFRFWNELAVSPGIVTAPHRLRGLDGRLPLESLLSVSKYMDGKNIIDNPYILPLGFEYTESYEESDFAQLNPLQKQQMLLQSIVIDNAIEPFRVSGDWKSKQLPYTAKYQNIDITGDILTCGEDAKIALNIDKTGIKGREGELYVVFSGFASRYEGEYMPVTVGDREVMVQSKTWKYYTGTDEYWVHVTSLRNGQIFISFPPQTQYSLSNIKVFWYDYEGMEEQIEALQDYAMQNIVYGNGKIAGEIDAVDGWLFFSIPYTEDWHAYIDGQEEKILLANEGFMAVEIKKGEHEVELRYCPKWMIMGLISTVIGICGILLLTVRKFPQKGSLECLKI